MKKSLKNRLLQNISVPLVLGLLAIGLGSYHSARKEAGKMYDAQLAHFAYVLHEITIQQLAKGDVYPQKINIQTKAVASPYEKDLSYRVWWNEQLVLQSEHTEALGEKPKSLGFTEHANGEHHVRLFVMKQNNVLVEVAEDFHVRTALIHEMALSVLLPFFFVIPMLGLAIFLGLRIGLRPLNALSSHVAGLDPDALQCIGTDISLPPELAPFVASINQLMRRVEEVIEREKRFTGYAAHELRTPLAALKTQLQVALREKDLVFAQQMYHETLTGVDRMAHLVNQLLLLLRSQKESQTLTVLNLSKLVNEVASGFEKSMAIRHQHLRIEANPDIFCQGNAEMLRVLVRNLLDNAGRYSAEGTYITLTLKQPSEHAFELSVHNTGVALTDEECFLIFEPFYRSKATKTEGAGLGLAIVSWIARMHHLQVQARCENDGLMIRVLH